MSVLSEAPHGWATGTWWQQALTNGWRHSSRSRTHSQRRRVWAQGRATVVSTRLVEGLAVVDADDRADHLGHNDGIAQVRPDRLGLVACTGQEAN